MNIPRSLCRLRGISLFISYLSANCNIEITILYSEKEFLKNSSLITRNAVSYCDIGAYSGDSPYTTRHHTHHQIRCILLRTWMLHVRFTLSPLVTLKKVTSESALQLVLYQNDIPHKGNEWVTSETKWITAVILWCTYHYNAAGDELQSSVKILFPLL